MKISLVLAGLALFSALLVRPNRAQSDEAKRPPAIAWQPSWAGAQELARRTHKPVLIYFGASWCGPCHRLEKEALSQNKVIRESQNWVAWKADLDKEGDLAARYSIETPPTLLFLSAEGRVIGRLVGFYDAPTVAAAMKRARQQPNPTS